jgi:hypothetical protein
MQITGAGPVHRGGQETDATCLQVDGGDACRGGRQVFASDTARERMSVAL